MKHSVQVFDFLLGSHDFRLMRQIVTKFTVTL
jgi:hypothetical protein